MEGETLAAKLKNGPLPVGTALLYASQIAAALAEAHGKGIIHRDLKPGNIMIGKSGVKVLDFGLARVDHQDETVTADQMIIGTPAYMAPEQRVGQPADALSDVYSFGCVLFEMFTGTRVGSPQRRRITPRRMEKIVNRCLEEDRERRWQSSAELQRALAAVTPAGHSVRMAIAGVAVLALSAFAYSYFFRAPKLMPKDRIVLADANYGERGHAVGRRWRGAVPDSSRYPAEARLQIYPRDTDAMAIVRRVGRTGNGPV